MPQTHLHLVDSKGNALSPAIRTAVESAFAWVLHEYPRVDPAIVASWAEQVAGVMETKTESHASPRRYAHTALRWKVLDWLRSGAAREEPVGIGPELERFGGADGAFERTVERSILFEQLKATLNERDRFILVLLLQDNTSPASVGKTLGVSYAAAAKAIQRVRERISTALIEASGKGSESTRYRPVL